MSITKCIAIFAFGFLFSSCNQRVSVNGVGHFDPIEESEEVYFFLEDDLVSDSWKHVADLKVKNGMLSENCTLPFVLESAEKVSRAKGGNVVLIEKIKSPNGLKYCYEIKGQIYKVDDPVELVELISRNLNQNKGVLNGSEEYALIHFYRSKNFAGSAIKWRIRENGELVTKLKHNSYYTLKTTDFGTREFNIHSEVTENVDLDVEPGKEYFVNCGIKKGKFKGRPAMSHVDNWLGIRELNKIKI